ncbi:hypothetical protein [Bacillus sp. NPDC060175]|uniref:hypothetical protein n=1 Tax=Bacillus sp. NPDC060175 TaxID=3347061 RepID=UPI003645FD9E
MEIEVLKVPMDNNRIIYILLDTNRKPIEVVAKYMKYLYNSKRAPNTLKDSGAKIKYRRIKHIYY